MQIDISVLVTKFEDEAQWGRERHISFGHLGTHFNVMDKEFPLHFLKRSGVFFNVKGIYDREISRRDIDSSLIEPDSFVAFYSAFIDEKGYGSQEYFTKHPQLSNDLIDLLLEKGVSIIGVDFAGVRRGKEHVPADQRCADRGVFVVENLANLGAVLQGASSRRCLVNTYPVKFAGLTGLPCRVVAEV